MLKQTIAMVVLVALSGVVLVSNSFVVGDDADTSVNDQAQGPHYFEQRVYTAADGKLPNLHARFRNHTNHLFVKHGMKLIGYWTPVDQPNTLVYILAYPSKKAREASWKGFMADPEWQQVWAKSKEEAGGPLVTKIETTFMTPTDYSPLR